MGSSATKIIKNRVRRHLVVQPEDENYRLIPLTRGQNAIVDVADFEYLSQWNWTAMWVENCQSFYVIRMQRDAASGKKRMVLMHRQLLGEEHAEIDHKNHNPLDNRRDNLRPCDRLKNVFNTRVRKDSATGFKGVYFNPTYRRWYARIKANGRRKHLGTFKSPEGAAMAYYLAAKQYFGEFASTNA